jgi:hypothetical protein
LRLVAIGLAHGHFNRAVLDLFQRSTTLWNRKPGQGFAVDDLKLRLLRAGRRANWSV